MCEGISDFASGGRHARDKTVLVLNQTTNPDICNVRRAIVPFIGGKAKSSNHTRLSLHGAGPLPLPSVIRLVCMIRAPRARVKLTAASLPSGTHIRVSMRAPGERLTLAQVIAPSRRSATWRIRPRPAGLQTPKGRQALQEARMVPQAAAVRAIAGPLLRDRAPDRPVHQRRLVQILARYRIVRAFRANCSAQR